MKIRISNDVKAMGSSTLAIIIVGLLLLTGLTYAGYSFWLEDDPTESNVKRVADGDTVECNYIGMFTDKRVFDTSLEDVAYDNLTYPKSLQFNIRPRDAYTPYSFTVGSGDTIQGWQDAVDGMVVGQKKTVTIPYEDAYGEKDPSQIHVNNLTEFVPIFKTMDLYVFMEKYEGVAPTVGGTFLHFNYRWICEVTFVDEDSGIIEYRNRPEINQYYKVYGDDGWQVKITKIDQSAGMDGTITLEHQISSNDAGNEVVTHTDGQFILTDVNEVAGTYTIDYNREVVGADLVFEITVLNIYKED